jgi:hypothetical protein
MARKEDFDRSVPLPPGLSVVAIRKAIDYVERHLADLVEIYYEQANVFSAIVGIFGTKALDAVSNYERHRNIDTAQQRFPDLKRRGCGSNPKPGECLESKGSKRPWAISITLRSPRLVYHMAVPGRSDRIDRTGETGNHMASRCGLPGAIRLEV